MYPSAQLLLVNWLATKFTAAARVATDLPEDLDAQLPVIIVRRFGGSDHILTFDHANCDVDVWASNLLDAEVLAAQVRVALRIEIVGVTVTVGSQTGTIARVETISAPSERPADWGGATTTSAGTATLLTGTRRIGASYRITIHSH